MRTFPFYKYHGTGNDFILIDDRQEQFPAQDSQRIEALCKRRFGIGADGLILLQNSPKADFRMVYFNADGRLSSFCGNGGRCLVAFAHFLGVIEQEASFEAFDGLHRAEVREEGKVIALQMQDVPSAPKRYGAHFWLDTGSPHWVEFVEDTENFPVVEKGREIRYNPPFEQDGTNVNFIRQTGTNALSIRTYERGVEDETYSCGTGVTAAALVLGTKNTAVNEVTVKTQGGVLHVRFEPKEGGGFQDIWLTGPARQVFSGVLKL